MPVQCHQESSKAVSHSNWCCRISQGPRFRSSLAIITFNPTIPYLWANRDTTSWNKQSLRLFWRNHWTVHTSGTHNWSGELVHTTVSRSFLTVTSSPIDRWWMLWPIYCRSGRAGYTSAALSLLMIVLNISRHNLLKKETTQVHPRTWLDYLQLI